MNHQRRRCFYRRMLRNFFNRYSILMVWAIGNVVMFSCTFTKYKNEPQYYYLRQMLGYGLCISRSSGTMINISCALILLPMCRSFMTITRRLNRKVSLNFFRNLADHAKAIHVSCAYTIVFAAVIHVAAHLVNAVNFSRHFSLSHPDLNLAQFSGQNPLIAMFSTVAGITGVLMFLILLVIVFTSIKFVRYKFYNLFWYCHHLMFVFVLLLFLHPLGGILKEQVNLEVHPPEICQLSRRDVRINVTSPSCGSTRPEFLAQKSHIWKWMMLPLTIYALDFTLRRFGRASEPATVLSVRHFRGSVVRLTLRRPNLVRPRPGQFVFLNCPSVSSFEWHPFSVSSCGFGCDFDVHIRIRGDWSCKLSDQLNKFQQVDARTLSAPSMRLPKLYVDGPFCSPFEDVVRGPISVCIAGGIGITPFASVLHALLAGDVDEFVKLRRLHLLWSCRDGRSFTWFADLLCALHFKLWNLNRPDLLQIQLFLTSEMDSERIKAILCARHGLLIPRLEIGRPNWRRLFMDWTNAYQRKQINVFSCGPTSLNRQIKSFCSSLNGTKRTSFRFQHESFS